MNRLRAHVRKMIRLMLLGILPAIVTGCAGLGKGRGIDDTPMYDRGTVGGAWPERARAAQDDIWGDASDRWNNQNQEGAPAAFSQNPNVAPPTKRLYKNSARVTSRDFRDESPNEGSLWGSTGQTNYFFTRNRIKDVGDIINIEAEDQLVKDAAEELKRSLTDEDVESELSAAQKKLKEEAIAKKAAEKGGRKRAPAGEEGEEEEDDPEDVEVRDANMDDIKLEERVGFKTGDKMLAEIVERYPNGNYKVRSTKRIPYKGGERLMTLVGVAKSNHVNDQESIKSGSLYEYRLRVLR